LFAQKKNFGRERRRWSQTEHQKTPGIGTQLTYHRCHLVHIVQST
jgi:hypothetical protein